ncbi:hypothetical protein ABFV57_33450, partial [Pseudomonas neuropathica]|uniref:hypothetical protein n=1 Tax=Pseudomonas neuropathica TaxID=2730425 RepID=UPI0034D50729
GQAGFDQFLHAGVVRLGGAGEVDWRAVVFRQVDVVADLDALVVVVVVVYFFFFWEAGLRPGFKRLLFF